ncbi:DegT/DnrJ/EryC1/StrS family aminotransferase [Synechococcus sp. UW140]|uniref:DegT/DnrJ/EryC1/StrS family aminotransferase n=1 Tax=Synechococcus sp. UW140 TaxID=368503 RepID=UPI003137B65A
MIPFLDLKSSYLELKDQIDNLLHEVLSSGVYIGGDKVLHFESEWAKYCLSAYSVGVASGLDALCLALQSLDIGQDDEVIVPSHTFIATWLSVSRVGAKPVPVDVNKDDYNIDTYQIEDAITSKTKAILVVHLYGQPCNIDHVRNIANAHNLYVIEDAAQAHGAEYKSSKIGSHSDVVAWSFYPGKNLGAFGDAGAITTNSMNIYNRIKSLQNYGSIKRYVHTEIGCNSRLDPLQAAILTCKLNFLDDWNKRRDNIAAIYSKKIINNHVLTPFVRDYSKSSWHLYVICLENRAHFQEYMSNCGIQTLIHYPIPPYRQKAYSQGYKNTDFPVSSYISDRIVSLPIYPHLSIQAANYIADVVSKYRPNI